MKRDASRSCAAAGSAAPAGRARSVPRVSPGSAARPRAGSACAPAAGTPRRSTAGRGRSRRTAAPGAGHSTHANVRPGRPTASTPPMASAAGIEASAQSFKASGDLPCSSVAWSSSLDETRPSVQYFVRTVCSDTVGRGGLNNCPVVLAAAPVLVPAVSAVLPLRRQLAQGPQRPTRPRSGSITGSARLRHPPRDAYAARRAPNSPRDCAHTVSRRLVHGGGRSALATNRPTAAVGKPCSPHRPSPPRPPPTDPPSAPLTPDPPYLAGSVSVSAGGSSFGERQSSSKWRSRASATPTSG